MTVRGFFEKVWRFLGSFALAIAILLLLLALTYAGTMAQRYASIHDVQTKYFNSYLVVIELPLGIPFPVPGANLLMSLLFINLIVGGMIRLRRDWRRAGIFIIHLGIALMLTGNLVEFLFAEKGYMPLGEGESGDQYYSYTEWEIAVLESTGEGKERVHIVPGEQFEDLGPADSVSVSGSNLPFTLILTGFVPNCEPAIGPEGPVLRSLPLDPEEGSRNIAGISAAAVDSGGMRRETILWGRGGSAPWVFKTGGKDWGVVLRKRQFQLPFRVELRKAEGDNHPGTGMASRYASDVTRYEGNTVHDVHISMNEPMRHSGYIFYQSGFQPPSRMTGGRAISTFSVSRNPTDRVPLYACIVIAIGLLWHFLVKLYGYTMAEVRRREKVANAAS
ncbi:MAG: cytochrome c biogenesis protein ResB [Planctomycetota bacterium]|jgi:hypothetical protein